MHSSRSSCFRLVYIFTQDEMLLLQPEAKPCGTAVQGVTRAAVLSGLSHTAPCVPWWGWGVMRPGLILIRKELGLRQPSRATTTSSCRSQAIHFASLTTQSIWGRESLTCTYGQWNSGHRPPHSALSGHHVCYVDYPVRDATYVHWVPSWATR